MRNRELRNTAFVVITILTILLLTLTGCNRQEIPGGQTKLQTETDSTGLVYILPAPVKEGNISVEEALAGRRTHRHFQNRSITAQDLSQILWAAYGITMKRVDYGFLRGGLRTAPSAGALYPLELYVLTGNVKGIEPGVYKYVANGHKIINTQSTDLREELRAAALDQEMISEAPAVLFYSAVYSRTTEKYGERGRERYVAMDLGHSAQNVYLQTEAMHMGTCAIGAFNDEKVKKVMQLPKEEVPLYIMPFGYYYDEVEF